MAQPKGKKAHASQRVREFEQLFPHALRSKAIQSARARSNDPYLRLLRIVQAIKSADELTDCIDAYCRMFDPAKPQSEKHAPDYARLIGRGLFLQAAKLSGPLNGFGRLIDALQKSSPPKSDDGQARFGIWSRRWWFLAPGDQADIIREKNRRPTYLISHLINHVGAAGGETTPGLNELLAFNGWAEHDRERLKNAASGWSGAWYTALSYERRPDSKADAIKAVKVGIEIFRTWLKLEMQSPLDFFRLAKHTRDLGLSSGWDLWAEVYLEVIARGLIKARFDWKLSGLYNHMFAGDDLAFILGGIPTIFFGQEWTQTLELMRIRLGSLEKGIDKLNSESEARRNCQIVASYYSAYLTDELELKKLAREMDEGWENRPLEVLARKITRGSAPNQAERHVGTYWINQELHGFFTVIWIDARLSRVYFELHAVPGVIFNGNSTSLFYLNDDGFFKQLARNAAALTEFMLFCFEVVGWAADIATAGMSGGFRRIVWEFAKERIKEKAFEKGMETLGIDNPWITTAAGFGLNFVKFPKKKPKLGRDIGTGGAHPGGGPPGPALDAPDRVAATGNRTGIPDQTPPPRSAAGPSEPAPRPPSGADPPGKATTATGAAGPDEESLFDRFARRREAELARSRQESVSTADSSGHPAPGRDAPPRQGSAPASGSDGDSFMDRLRRRQEAEAAARARTGADPTIEQQATAARDQAMGRRTEATSQHPISAAEDARMREAGVSQMRDYDARAAEQAERDMARGAFEVKATAAQSGGSGGGGGGQVVGRVSPARGSTSGSGGGGGSGGTGRAGGPAAAPSPSRPATPSGRGKKGGNGSGKPPPSARATRPSAPQYQPTEKPLSPTEMKKALRDAEQNRQYVIENEFYGQKATAYSQGAGISYSGPGTGGTPAGIPQRKPKGGPEVRSKTGDEEIAIWVDKYEQMSGTAAPRTYRDYRMRGDNPATHAEVKDRIAQLDGNLNTPTSVSQDMCPHCRRWYQATAQHQGKTFIVNDGTFSRVFRPDGSVEIRRPSGDLRRIIPPGQPPRARGNTYFGVEW